MQQASRGPFKLFMTLFLSVLMAGLSGCASGGFKLTRSYAQFVNKQNILIRIVLYILTAVVFAVTMLIDMVVFNTVDFWEGRVSAGDYQFKEGERTYHVKHQILPENSLKKSTIQITGPSGQLLQTVVLAETQNGEIELLVDGVLRTKVQDLSGIPVASFFSAQGFLVEQKVVFLDIAVPLMAKQ